MTKATIEEVLQIVSDLRGESSTNTSAIRVRAVSRAERDFARRKFWRTHLLEATKTGDGTTTDFEVGSATFPMRLKGLTEIFVGEKTQDKKYPIIDKTSFLRETDTYPTEKLAYEWYDATNDKWMMTINPAPASGDTVYYSYYWEPPVKASTENSVYCPNMMILAKLALGDINEGEDEIEKANLVKNEAEQMINELVALDNAPSKNELISMTASEGKGLGNY